MLATRRSRRGDLTTLRAAARTALLVAALCAVPAAAFPVDDAIQDAVKKSDIFRPAKKPAKPKAEKPAKPPKKHNILVVPLPLSNPVLGSGVTLVAADFWNPNHSAQPWITGVGAMYTSNKSKGFGALHKMALDHDKYQVTAFAAYGDVNVKFYGIGPNAGARDASVKLSDKGKLALLEGLMRIAPDLYIGPRYQFISLKTTIDNPKPLFPDLNLPPFELRSTESAIGPSIAYDSRDNTVNPRTGDYVTIAWLWNVKALGSDFSHNKMQLNASVYRPLGPGTVIAVNGALCEVSKGAPFYDLCLYGQQNELRGYESGRYRDRATWATQVELRQHLFWRIGVVAFAGAGGVASSFSDLNDSKFLPAAGGGLRIEALKSNHVNIRLDYAVGKDSNALYFGIAEAF